MLFRPTRCTWQSGTRPWLTDTVGYSNEMFRISVPPDLIIGKVGGVSIRLIAVSSEKLMVLCRGVPNAETRSQDAAFAERYETWAQEASENPDTRGPPPVMPGEGLSRLKPVLRDDLGTVYSMDLVALAGYPGTEWEAEWTFTPAIPTNATSLFLDFLKDGRLSAEVSLALS